MRPARAGLLLIALLLGCFRGGSAPVSTPEVDVMDVARFSERIESFYSVLENVPIDAVMTFENPALPTFFASQSAYMDYYSSLANQVRGQNMLNTRPRKVIVSEFHFEGPDEALVEVTLSGPYRRTLWPWDVEVSRVDTWKRLDGVWLLTPDKL